MPASSRLMSFNDCAYPSHVSWLLICFPVEHLNVEVVGEVGPTSVELSWNDQPKVENYQVSYVRTIGVINRCDHEVLSGIMFTTATGVTLNNLEEDSVYSVTVTAMTSTDIFVSTIEITTAEAGNVHTT